MSENQDEKPPEAAERAAELPQEARIIEIDLRNSPDPAAALMQIFGQGPKVPHLELIAMTAALVMLMEELSHTNPDHGGAILFGQWMQIHKRLGGAPAPGYPVAHQFFNEYFTHRGDWVAMRQCAQQHGEQRQTRPGEFDERLQHHIAESRKVYEEKYGAKAS